MLLVCIQVCKFRLSVFTARSVAVRRGMIRRGGSGRCFSPAVFVVMVFQRRQVGERRQAVGYSCLPSPGAGSVTVAKVVPKPAVVMVLLFKRKGGVIHPRDYLGEK